MSSTEDRIRELAQKLLGRDLGIDTTISDTEISSMDLVAFLKKVGEEFDIAISNVDAIRFQNLRDLVEFIDARR